MDLLFHHSIIWFALVWVAVRLYFIEKKLSALGEQLQALSKGGER